MGKNPLAARAVKTLALNQPGQPTPALRQRCKATMGNNILPECTCSGSICMRVEYGVKYGGGTEYCHSGVKSLKFYVAVKTKVGGGDAGRGNGRDYAEIVELQTEFCHNFRVGVCAMEHGLAVMVRPVTMYK